MAFDPETTLRARWSKREQDVMIEYPRKCDGHLIHYYMGSPRQSGQEWVPSLFEELEKRGYDLTTLKFSIKKKV